MIISMSCFIHVDSFDVSFSIENNPVFDQPFDYHWVGEGGGCSAYSY